MADQAVGLLSPWLRRARIRAVLPFLQGRVLDYGCGIGALAEHISPDHYMGFDTDAESTEEAIRAHPTHAFVTTVPPARFDTIVALALIEHLDDQQSFLQRTASLLAEHGRIVLTTPHPGAEIIHALGARMGLFSRSAAAEHTVLLDRDTLRTLAESSGLRITHFARFLVGLNQLVVLERAR